MQSKRFRQLPEKTKDLTADVIENLLTTVTENITKLITFSWLALC